MTDDLLGDRLLVIDDEPAFGQIVKGVAEACGFEVIVTDDPSAFVNAARQWHPTVIMLDLKMPGTDGVQLLRTLAADNCLANVVLTSGTDGKVLESAMQLGRERGLKMSEALSKPMRVERLQERLAGLKGMAKPLLAADLAAALAADQLFLEYQPKLDCRLGRITGAEALVRWRHPTRGIIQPIQFIALAEETGLIHGVTDWVVATAAAQAARWRADNLGLEVAVAVNFSARDLVDLDLPDRLEQHCRTAGSDPAFLTLELTETGAMREAVQMMDVLTRLRLKGFRLSIDDFGTGYSSLVQLQTDAVLGDQDRPVVCHANDEQRGVPGHRRDHHRPGAQARAEERRRGRRGRCRAEDPDRHGLRHGAGLLHKPADRGGPDAAVRRQL